ncbi:hypothetical protein COLO4_24381 [Corchorus olitorius]|uniref:Uncharacterized protein n=1 Tax=Corchorus olitorius TaxID=93759 RepID=A0A1R3IAS2_9ROSI|nr:hypothetical protein COLO4_24381 [Corchorus olitorius]
MIEGESFCFLFFFSEETWRKKKKVRNSGQDVELAEEL